MTTEGTTTPISDHLKRRIDVLRGSPAYENYLQAREHVLRMKDDAAHGADGVAEPSDYWQEELSGFEYMLDASPLIVEKLRHHCYHVTGIRVYDYRTHKDRGQEQMEQKLRALVDVGGSDLLVPESPLLGGFGFEIDGHLYNIDTLKFFEVLIALDKGAVLGEFRNSAERRVVLEIGAGWGGFAYQFKSLWPNTTYVIVDLPELFLFSATYLKTAFPDARIAFAESAEEDLDERWLDADFIFVPNTRLEVVTPPRLDLTINMVSFQEMTTEQVDAYVRHAAEQKSAYLYSLNRERSLYNPALSGVHGIISRYFWPHEIDVLPVSYTKMLDKSKVSKAKTRVKSVVKEGIGQAGESDKTAMDYKHVIGWPRMT
jgi:hypothetical protein